jgi:hypothetical protein
MALKTITLSVSSPAEGFAWNVNFSAEADTTPIKSFNNPQISIICPTNTSGNFTVSNTAQVFQAVNGYSSDAADSGADSYVTWRSTAITGQYPSSGRSLDIWSHQFYLDVKENSQTWADIGDGATYTLNPRKWSLIYNYTSRYAAVWSKGGTLTVSVV